MKKVLIIIGSVVVVYVFLSVLLPQYLRVPLASYNSYKSWAEHNDNNLNTDLPDIAKDSLDNFPFPIGSVSDYEHVFNENQISILTEIISDYEEETTREIAIVTIPSIDPYDNIEDYSTDLANTRGIGNPETDNGLLILFSKHLRQIRISTGLGTQKVLTDEICQMVIDETIIPKFRDDEYYKGTKMGLMELIELWK